MVHFFSASLLHFTSLLHFFSALPTAWFFATNPHQKSGCHTRAVLFPQTFPELRAGTHTQTQVRDLPLGIRSWTPHPPTHETFRVKKKPSPLRLEKKKTRKGGKADQTPFPWRGPPQPTPALFSRAAEPGVCARPPGTPAAVRPPADTGTPIQPASTCPTGAASGLRVPGFAPSEPPAKLLKRPAEAPAAPTGPDRPKAPRRR